MDDWKTRARVAREKLRSARYGGKEKALLEAAGGLDINTARRMVYALDFLEGLVKRHPKLGNSLMSAPFSPIEIIARWHGFDGKGAIGAARRLARGGYSVKVIEADMLAARKKVPAAKGGESFEAAYRAKFERAAWRAVSDKFGENVSVPDVQWKDNSDDPPIDFRYQQTFDDRQPKSIVALIVGPYQNKSAYGKRRSDWLFRALALCWFHDEVVLLLPKEGDLKSYSDWAAKAAIRATPRTPAAEDAARSVPRLPSIHVINPEPWDDDPPSRKPKRRRALNKIDEEALSRIKT